MRLRRPLVIATLTLTLTAAAAVPSPALAHGLVARADLPIPKWLFAWAAGVVLLVSFVALAVLWPRPQLELAAPAATPGRLGALPFSRAVRTAAGAVGVGLLALIIWSGIDGSQTVGDNIAPTFVFVAFWVGLVPASILLGDVFRAFNPWAALARVIAAVAARLSRRALPPPLQYPRWLGRWPAVVGLIGFAYMELAAGNGAAPQNIAIAAIVYSTVTSVAMSLVGVEPWLDNAEAFSVYFNLFSRISPLQAQAGRVVVRRPLSGLTQLDTSLAGTVPLLAVMIGTVTFDGAGDAPAWLSIRARITDFFSTHGFPDAASLRLASTIGLLSAVLLVLMLYRIGAAGVRYAAGGGDAANAFVHTLVPIAAAYVGAHYLSFLLTQGQAVTPLASDPLGQGWNLFGTAGRLVDYGIIGVTATWYFQVLLVIAGHLAGLTAAHDRALVLYGDPRVARRSQYWMLGVMVAFTFLALVLLAQAGA